jgi:hypothetical protein
MNPQPLSVRSRVMIFSWLLADSKATDFSRYVVYPPMQKATDLPVDEYSAG